MTFLLQLWLFFLILLCWFLSLPARSLYNGIPQGWHMGSLVNLLFHIISRLPTPLPLSSYHLYEGSFQIYLSAETSSLSPGEAQPTSLLGDLPNFPISTTDSVTLPPVLVPFGEGHSLTARAAQSLGHILGHLSPHAATSLHSQVLHPRKPLSLGALNRSLY